MELDAHVTAERSAAAPSVACWQQRLHLAWTGSDMHLNVMASSDGVGYGPKLRLAHTSSRLETSTDVSVGNMDRRTIGLAPAIAAGESGTDIGWTGTDRRLNVLSLASHDPATLGETSYLGPTLANVAGELALAWTGNDRHVNDMTTQSGTFGPKSSLDARSSTTPALCALGDRLVLAWTGSDRRINVMVAGAEGQRLEAKSSDSPALCALADEVVLAWTGTDRHINVMVSRGCEFGEGEAQRLEAKTSFGPALGAHLGPAYLAWTGTDGRINVARMLS
ncbi:MAG: hypothetical protein M3N98_07610 [Actinomycetota bacterium]|nr:hypothetical protein [Actinomycetota bacterium]